MLRCSRFHNREWSPYGDQSATSQRNESSERLAGEKVGAACSDRSISRQPSTRPVLSCPICEICRGTIAMKLTGLLLLGLVIGIVAIPRPDQGGSGISEADSGKTAQKTEAMKEAQDSGDQSTTDSDKDGDHDDDDDGDDDHSDSKMMDGSDSAVMLFPFFGSYVYQRLQESLQQVQNQLDNMWNMSLNSTGLMDIPDDYHNSTSSTKIVNGTVVTVNETVRKSNEDGIQSVYHIRVISLRPESSEDDSSQQMSQQKVAQGTTLGTDDTVTTVAPETDS